MTDGVQTATDGDSATPHSAAASLAGYLWQLHRTFLLLSRCEVGQVVELETRDDIVILTRGEIVRCVQAKHSSEPALLTSSSPLLWKTIGIWLNVAAQPVVSFNAVYELCVTHVLEPGLKHLLKPVHERSDHELLETVDVLDAASEKSKSKKLVPAFEQWNRLSKEERARFVRNVLVLEAQPALEESRRAVREVVWKLGIADTSTEDAASYLLGWFTSVVEERLGLGLCTVSAEEYHAACIELHRRYSASPLLAVFGALDVANELQTGRSAPNFIRQMELIGLQQGELLGAYVNVVRATLERNRWLNQHIAGMSELTAMEADIETRWLLSRNRAARNLPPTGSAAPEEVGRDIYDTCTGSIASLRGAPAPAHVHIGTCHLLADQPHVRPRIGWHPDYHSLLGEREP